MLGYEPFFNYNEIFCPTNELEHIVTGCFIYQYAKIYDVEHTKISGRILDIGQTHRDHRYDPDSGWSYFFNSYIDVFANPNGFVADRPRVMAFTDILQRVEELGIKKHLIE